MSLTSPDAATRLSTAPEPLAPPPARPSRWTPLRRGWRQLTSMRTALLLLFLLALASVPGSFLPQRGQNPQAVDAYLAAHPTLGPILDRLSLFDSFAAPWFAAVYLLLFVSLVGCLVPRIRLHARALRTPPPAVPRVLVRLPVHARWETAAPPDEVLADVRRQLRRRRFRVVRRDGALSAEKGYLRETGNLLFHVSLVVLLVGIALGGLFGFSGTVLLKEGDGFASTVLSYDDIKPGRRFDPASLVPFNVQLDKFNATYGDDGKALTFDADIRYARGGAVPTTPYDLRVNHPLEIDGAKTYLLGHGYAPDVLVRDVEGNELRQSVPCLPQGPTFFSVCTIKVPDAAGQQLAFEGLFTPTTIQDPQTGRVTSVFPAAEAPALTLAGLRGDLKLDEGGAQSVYSIADRSGLTPIDDGKAHRLDPGQTWELPGGGSITFLGTRQWVTLQVSQDPGKLVALVGGTGMILGLCLSLFVRRRRVWVRARPAGASGASGSTVVEVAGLARTGSDAFETEFADLAERVRTAAPPLDTRPPETAADKEHV